MKKLIKNTLRPVLPLVMAVGLLSCNEKLLLNATFDQDEQGRPPNVFLPGYPEGDRLEIYGNPDLRVVSNNLDFSNFRNIRGVFQPAQVDFVAGSIPPEPAHKLHYSWQGKADIKEGAFMEIAVLITLYSSASPPPVTTLRFGPNGSIYQLDARNQPILRTTASAGEMVWYSLVVDPANQTYRLRISGSSASYDTGEQNFNPRAVPSGPEPWFPALHFIYPQGAANRPPERTSHFYIDSALITQDQ